MCSAALPRCANANVRDWGEEGIGSAKRIGAVDLGQTSLENILKAAGCRRFDVS